MSARSVKRYSALEGEHPIGLANSTSDEVVDHDAKIAVRPIEHRQRSPTGGHCRIQPGHDALPCGFFVSGGAVDLPGQEQPAQALGLEGRIELTRIHVVVFDRVARPHHLHPLQAWDAGEDRKLDLLRQRGRDAIGIDRRIVEPFRLQKDLMTVAVAEADDLVLDRRAITRPGALDLAGVHRRAMDIGADHLMGGGRGPGDPALDLRGRDPLGQDRERLRRLVSGLHLDGGPVDRGAIQTGRRAGLEAPEGEAGTLEGA
ncbi:hypothetical protein ABIG06_002540 [Bradyrhizobium sp. USDA 326]